MPEQTQNVGQAQGPTTQPPGSGSLFFFGRWMIHVTARKPKIPRRSAHSLRPSTTCFGLKQQQQQVIKAK
jgi:hypothetical protein